MPEDVLYVKDLIEELKQMNPYAELWIQREDKHGTTIFPIRYLEECEHTEYGDYDKVVKDEVYITYKDE